MSLRSSGWSLTMLADSVPARTAARMRLPSGSIPRPFASPMSPNLRRTSRFHQYRQASSLSPSASSGTRERPIRFNFPTVVMCFVPILTGFLGVWQLKRLKWKLALIEEVDESLKKEAMILPDEINLNALHAYAFRRVLLRGHFATPPMLFGPKTYDGVPGYNVIQPFVRSPANITQAAEADSMGMGGYADERVRGQEGAGGEPTTILVNRGFITSTRAAAYRAGTEGPPPSSPSCEATSSSPPASSSRSNADAGGEVIIQGMIRKASEGRGWAPENNKEGNEWFWADVEGMADWVGGKEKGIQAVLVDEIYDESMPAAMLLAQGMPVGRPPVVELRNMHATYAATWLSLSAVTSVMLFGLLAKGRGWGGAMSKRRKGGGNAGENPRLRGL